MKARQVVRPQACGGKVHSTFKGLSIEGHWGWSSKSPGLEKRVIVPGRWAEARGNSNQIYIFAEIPLVAGSHSTL